MKLAAVEAVAHAFQIFMLDDVRRDRSSRNGPERGAKVPPPQMFFRSDLLKFSPLLEPQLAY